MPDEKPADSARQHPHTAPVPAAMPGRQPQHLKRGVETSATISRADAAGQLLLSGLAETTHGHTLHPCEVPDPRQPQLLDQTRLGGGVAFSLSQVEAKPGSGRAIRHAMRMNAVAS